MLKKAVFLSFCLMLLALPVFGQLVLPKLVSDGMVLQRDADISVWGWASSGETVRIEFRDETYRATTGEQGKWEVTLDEQQAGGPFDMQISSSGGEAVKLTDILVGDVWVASGQSNMELPMNRVRPLYEREIREADFPQIRYFEVPKTYDFTTTRKDLAYGEWQRVSPDNVGAMSAVAFFFARNLQEEYGIPVGIILSALGGSPAESWISEDALREFPVHYNEMQIFKDSLMVEKLQASDQARSNAWYSQSQQADQGYQGEGDSWANPSTDYSTWDTMNIPGYWADESLGAVNGVVWFHKEISISEEDAGKPASLELGRVVDADSVFVNGTFVGTTGYQYPPRWYDVPEGVLREGANHIVVRVINTGGRGGFLYDKPYELVTSSEAIDLKGAWDYKLGVEMPPLAGPTFIRWKPGGLYNAMISPLLSTSIKGVIWYQGESNAGRPQEYEELFPALIRNWREKWNQPDLPFLYVQLANYMRASDTPTESDWAELREAQRNTLSLAHTGMAVTIDIGEWNDIHPLNKKDVGERLARWARGMVYNEDNVRSGPLVNEITRTGEQLRLSFSHTGSGLTSEGDELKEFTIAGADGRFVSAQAVIEGDNVIVWSEQISNPVRVRYAWEDNPSDANLYNQEGLPASPFEIEL